MRPSGREILAYAVVLVLVALVVVVIPATGALSVPRLPVALGEIREGRVVEIVRDELQSSQRGDVRTQIVLVDVEGRRVEIEHVFVDGSAGGFPVRTGDDVLVVRSEVNSGERFFIQERVRRGEVWALSLVFALLVVAVGGRRGVLSLIALAISILVIVRFIVPAIYVGWDPVLVAIAGALVIMSASLVIGHGPTRKTWIALGGTAISLGLTGVLAIVAVDLVQLTGLGDDDATMLQSLVQGVSASGLLLGGIIIGALGVLDDVTTTQASTVFELRQANSALGPRQLFLRGMNVGRDHIAATTNTLVLAYAGASLPLLMILAGQGEPLGILVSYEGLATEIVRTLVGSIGIVAAVPITTGLAALLVGSGRLEVGDGDGTEADAHAH